jgi:hypothetical protein
MNTEKFIEELKAFQKKTDEIIKELSAEKPQELTRETGMPNVKTPNYIILSNGITTNVNVIPETDYERFAIFETKEEAETERDYTLASRRVRSWAKAVNGDWKADWENNDKEKWGVKIVNTKLKVDWYTNYNLFIHQISFPTEELATKFLELFRPELEILASPS